MDSDRAWRSKAEVQLAAPSNVAVAPRMVSKASPHLPSPNSLWRRCAAVALLAALPFPTSLHPAKFFPFAVAQAGAADSNPLRAIESALSSRDYDHALQMIRAQLQQTPQDARLHTMEGIALAGEGNDQEALVAYNKALAISPNYLAALEGAAQLEYKAGSDRAVPLLNRILKLQPNEPTTHAMLGTMAYKTRDCPGAIKHFRASGPVLASQPSAMELFGACLMAQGRASEAVTIFDRLLATRPSDAHARYNLAVVQFTAKRNADAIATLQPLLEQTAPDTDALDLASAAYEETGDTPKAVDLLRRAIVANPKKVKYYVDFATLSFKHESFQIGVDMINAGVMQLPNDSSLYIARGILFIQLGQFENGQADFETANRLDPRQASASVAEGLAQLQQSNLDQALTTVDAQLKAHPQDSFLHYLKAEILTQKGASAGSPEFRQAMNTAAEAIRLRPDFVLARDVLGGLYLKSGQSARAIEQSRLALHDNPSDQVALYHLIQALRNARDPKGEVPGLVRRLAALREESQQVPTGTKYKLYEPGRTPTSDQPKP
jgi:tetratricopeptide (TPR) repeat protein